MMNAHHLRLLSKITIVAGAAMLILALSSLAQAQQRFKTPEEAVEALVKAARSGDSKSVVSILGPGSQELVSSGDPVEDAEVRKEYLATYDAGHRIVSEPGKPSVLVMGPDNWPFPIPMVQRDGQWIFDVPAGREEVLARRIGRNELSTMKAMLAYWDAQQDYADMNKSKSGQAIYAQRIISSPGKKDGLYWPTSGNEPPSPLGEAVAEATQRGNRPGAGEPYHGYRFKILLRQGPTAPPAAGNLIEELRALLDDDDETGAIAKMGQLSPTEAATVLGDRTMRSLAASSRPTTGSSRLCSFICLPSQWR